MPATPRPPQPTRSAAEARYRALRDAAFRAAGADLAVAGIVAELRSIDAAALDAVGGWSGRRVDWPWHMLAAAWRRNHPDRFEAAAWRDGVLCGLVLGRPAPTAPHLSLYWIEANPNPANPLRRNVALALFEPARRYALALGKAELRLIDPLPAVVPFYCSPALGFELVIPAKGGPYCRRSI